jgi:tetratricopeptide (TPR) repeat protein
MPWPLRSVSSVWVAACLLSRPASAQNPPVETEADRLFREAKALLEAGQATKACPKLEASQRLDPARGTLLNIGACYAQTGRLVEAQAVFRDVEQQAAAANDERRLAEARTQLRRLEAQIPHVVIEAMAPVAGLDVELDGVNVPRASWRDVRRNPGTVRVRAFAPGYQAHVETLDVAPNGATTTIRIPALAMLTISNGSARPNVTPSSRRRLLGYVVGGSGVLLLGAATGLALKANHDHNDTGCDNSTLPPTCSTEGGDESPLEKNRDAVQLAQIATVVGVTGLVAIGAGVVLYLTAPKTETIVTPTVTPDGAGVTFSGTF